MTRSNRTMNRLFLALVGLALVAVGGWGLLVAFPEWAELLPWAASALPGGALPVIAVPGADGYGIAAASALVVVALSLAWVFTRGRGRVTTIMRVTDGGGALEIDARLAGDIVTLELEGARDIAAVHASAYLVRGAEVLALSVTARDGADLERLLADTRRAVARLDELLEKRIPVSLIVTSDRRVIRARETRVA
jgi:hypothetical protein